MKTTTSYRIYVLTEDGRLERPTDHGRSDRPLYTDQPTREDAEAELLRRRVFGEFIILPITDVY